MGSGTSTDDIEVDLRLSVLKPLHASWMVSLYNHLTNSEGKRYVVKGWEKAGVAGVVKGESALPPEDPFEEIDNVLQL